MSKTEPKCPLKAACPDGSFVCPLSQVSSGAAVRVKNLNVSPDLRRRLRELGVREQQQIKLLMRHGSLVCQVCNARVGLSAALAKDIMVEMVTPGEVPS